MRAASMASLFAVRPVAVSRAPAARGGRRRGLGEACRPLTGLTLRAHCARGSLPDVPRAVLAVARAVIAAAGVGDVLRVLGAGGPTAGPPCLGGARGGQRQREQNR